MRAAALDPALFCEPFMPRNVLACGSQRARIAVLQVQADKIDKAIAYLSVHPSAPLHGQQLDTLVEHQESLSIKLREMV